MFEQINLDELLDSFVDWDRKGYRFDRKEKDMHPYSIINEKDKVIITHNILGIDKKDLRVIREKKNGDILLRITGKTVDSITKQEYSIDSKFVVDPAQLDLTKIQCTAKNGLVYIIIPNKEQDIELPKTKIEIL